MGSLGRIRKFGYFVPLLILFGLMVNTGNAQEDLIVEIIRDKIEQIRYFQEVKLGDASIASRKVLPQIYEQQNFQPVWQNRGAITELLEAVGSIGEDGLDPRDYHYKELQQYRNAIRVSDNTDPWLISDFDILLTDSFIRLAYHLFFGKVDPTTLHPGWNLSRNLGSRNPSRAILEIIRAGDIRATLDSIKPEHPAYLHLKSALAKYRKVQSLGGWEPIPEGGALKKGDRDPRIAFLRKRLALTDGAPVGSGDPELFDDHLEIAVKRFQTREEIEADGVVGRPTLSELNNPVEERIHQIRANLERMRWFLHDLPEKFVVVDIAGFQVEYYEQEQIVWKTRAQVGDPYTETPCFKAEIKYMVLNPSWTVPPGIAKRVYLPMMRENPEQLMQTGLKIINSKGKPIDPDGIDWERYANRAFPYRFYQIPGPTNPLGQIKFICPNPFYVFLHDTPETEKFDETWRAFSAGCIRVEKPFEFALQLLGDHDQWPIERIKKIIDSGKPRTIFLPRRIPVMFLYITVIAEPGGMIIFRDDLYGRDKAVIDGLKVPFKFKKAGRFSF